jgi:peroxiredoxin Q/BCP
MIKINDKAPDFCLKNQNGENVCLDDFKGKWKVVYFYPKDNTPGCTLEARDFSQHLKEFEKQNTSIIGISPDSKESHKKFQDKHNLKINLLSDPEHNTLKQYGVWKPKKMFGKEYMGVVRSTFLVDSEGKVIHIWPKVKVTGHADEILGIIKEKKEGEL